MRFESRSWDSSYRGPLWIHAGSTQPEQSKILEVEQQFEHFYKQKLEFPNKYPTSSLLGTVDLQTTLMREEYEEYIPKEQREPKYNNSIGYLF
jgi:hypothetical protein